MDPADEDVIPGDAVPSSAVAFITLISWSASASLLVCELLEVRDLSRFISEPPVPGVGSDTTWVS